MENTEVAQQSEPTPVTVEPTVSGDNTNNEQPVSEDAGATTNVEPVINEENSSKTTEETSVTTTEQPPVDENKQEEPATATTNEEERTTSIEEQENAIDTNSNVAATNVSPSRTNVPLKEVNESESDETAVMTNGTDNSLSKKRELEQEDQATDVNNDSDERAGGEQIKKIKTSESSDTPIIESNPIETNHIVNGNAAVEV